MIVVVIAFLASPQLSKVTISWAIQWLFISLMASITLIPGQK